MVAVLLRGGGVAGVLPEPRPWGRPILRVWPVPALPALDVPPPPEAAPPLPPAPPPIPALPADAPAGLSAMPPEVPVGLEPAGGSVVREAWPRDAKRGLTANEFTPLLGAGTV